MDHFKDRRHAFGLAALNVADHVPGNILRQVRHLGLGFPNAVFAKLAQAQFVGCTDYGGRLGLGHSHKPDLDRVPTGPGSRCCHPFLNRT